MERKMRGPREIISGLLKLVIYEMVIFLVQGSTVHPTAVVSGKAVRIIRDGRVCRSDFLCFLC